MKTQRVYLLVVLCLCVFTKSFAQIQTPKYVSITTNSNGYYEYLPAGYSNTQTYPLLIFIHGLGELGDGSSGQLPKILYHGVPKLINAGQFPASFTVGGQSHSFIVISPQFKGWPVASDINAVINYAIQNYKVNQNRIYVTGLSMGGGVTWEFAGAYASRVAAIVPVCGASWPDQARAQSIASAKVAVWATHNDFDGTVPSFYTKDYVDYINQNGANPAAIKSIWPSSSHDAWSQTYNPTYKENNMNIYEWMLQYSKNGTPLENQSPSAIAGSDQTITLPTNSVSLSGSGSDPDGTIATYSWSKISGPTGNTITTSSSASTTVTDLVQGVYTFRLTVTDNLGATASDDIVITANAAVNQSPTANAGSDQTITLPINSVSLSGSGSDPDGTIATYSWNKISGPTENTITTSSSASTTVTDLVQGVYTFRLTVTDNLGATASDDIVIIVNAAVNQSPTANAGLDQAITLPTSSISLSGSGSDADGTIGTYEWSKISGPTGNTITTPSSASTTVTDLVQGVYTFRLTVTDNLGATATDDIVITVNAAANQLPTANAGSDQTITLPTSSISLSGSGSDTDGTIATYEWSKISGPTGNTITTSSSASTTVTDIMEGVYTFRLTVTDNQGATATDDIVITVNAVANQLPTANAGSDQTITLPTSSISLSGSGSDTDGTIATYEWSKISGPTGNTITTSSSASTTVTDLMEGVYTFRLTVTDNQGATATDDIVITVNPAANQLPNANAGSDQTITLPTNSVSLSGSGSDTDGTIATYEWTKISGPTGNTITTSSSASTTVTDLVQGVYTFRLTVTDNLGATATDDVEISVNAAGNQLPTANAGSDQIITLPTNSVNLSGNGSDTDGTIATYEWTKISGPSANTITTPSSASTTVTDLVQGVYTFRLTVTDNLGATATGDVEITVNAAGNQLPTANAGPDQTITLPTSSVSLSGSGSDPDGTIATYSWTKISGPSANTITTSSLASTTVTDLLQGVYTFQLTITDNLGAAATDDVVIIVNAANQLPTAIAGPDQTITLPTNSVSLSGSGSDPDGTSVTNEWSKISGPSGYIITNSFSTSTTVTDLVQGVYTFRLTVTDTLGATATDDVVITVNAAANQLPTANAGSDQTITLPTNSVNLSGSGSDPDGTIATYAWSQISGPSGSIITTSTATSTTVTNLVQGVYTFQLTVTDNLGATASEDVVVTVKAAPYQAPTANSFSSYLLYDGQYSYGLNPGWYGFNWNTQQVCDLGAGNAAKGVKGIGAKSFRMALYDDFLTQWGKDILIPDYEHLKNLGTSEITAFVGAPHASHKWDTAFYNGYDSMSKVFRGMYEPVWLDSARTQINPANTYAKYLYETVKTYGDYVTFWEVVNEPDFSYGSGGWFGDNEPPIPGSWFDRDPTPQELVNLRAPIQYYIRMLRISWDVIKRLQPNDYVCTGGIGARSFLAALLRNTDNPDGGKVTAEYPLKAGAYFDVLSFHTYPEFTLKEWSNDNGGGFKYFRHSDAAINGHLTVKNRMDSLLKIDGYNGSQYPEKQFICTETGISRVMDNDNLGSNEAQKNYMIKAHVMTQKDGQVKQTYWYQTADAANSNNHWEMFGCYYYFGDKQPFNAIATDQGIALKTTSNLLYGKTYDPGRTFELNLPSSIDGAAFKGTDGSYVYVLWAKTKNDLSEIASANYNFPSLVAGNNNLKRKEWNYSQTASNVVVGLSNIVLTGTPSFFEITMDTLSVPNIAPTANAGLDKTITLPTNNVSLTGSGIDPDGTIVTYAWIKISGPSANTITSPAAATTTITGLVQGVYTFRLTVTDNKGITATDDVVVTVNAAGNKSPSANAGPDQTITLPQSSVSLSGSGTDPDGTIVSYAWTKISGPSAGTITTPAAAATTVTGLVQGVYIFRLTATDNLGAKASDDMVITVNAANQSPIVNAGIDKTITLPLNSVTLNGSGTDIDGSISSYSWSQIAGPSQAVIVSTNQVSSVVNSLVQGVYQFTLVITDNLGAIGKDTVRVTVNPAINKPPVANAGDDLSITLPVNNANLNGSGTDADGNIVSYLWTKLNGPVSHTISSSSTASTSVTALVEGIYTFRLTVTDNKGATASDDVRIIVNGVAPAHNVPPVAKAGKDTTITLPVNHIQITGTGTDVDGTVTAYVWSMIHGPANCQISSPSAPKTNITGLVEGTYQFKLTVFDNIGASGSDLVTVIVKPKVKTKSSALVYPNPATSEINIKIEALTEKDNSTIRIYNSFGSIVYSEEFIRTEYILIKQIDISRLAKGVYFVTVNADTNTDITLKFIKL